MVPKPSANRSRLLHRLLFLEGAKHGLSGVNGAQKIRQWVDAMAQAWGVWAVCKSEQLDASRSQPDVSVRRSSHRKEDLPGCARQNHRRPDCGGKQGLNLSIYPHSMF